MDSNQGTMVISPNSQEWCVLEEMEKKPPNPLMFYEDWDSAKLDERISWSSQRELWPSKAEKTHHGARVAQTNRASNAVMAVVCLLAVASLSLSILMLFGMIGSVHGSCVCSKEGPTPSAQLDLYSSKLKRIEYNLSTLQAEQVSNQEKLSDNLTTSVRETKTELGEHKARVQETVRKINADVGDLWTTLNVTIGNFQTSEENLNESMDNAHAVLADQLNNVSEQLRSMEKMFRRAVDEVNENLTARIQYDVAKLWLNVNSSLRCCNNLSAITQKLAAQMNSTFVTLHSVDAELQQSVIEVNASLGRKIEGEMAHLSLSVNSSLRCCRNLSVFTDKQAEQVNRTFLSLHATDAKLERNMETVNGSLNREAIAKVIALENSGFILKSRLNGFNATLEEKTAYLATSLLEVSSRSNKTKITLDEFRGSTAIELEKLNSTVVLLKKADASLSSVLQDVNSSLLSQLQNSSRSPGPLGPAGLNGSRGPPGLQGAGNFSLCRYGSKEAAVTSKANLDWSVFHTEPDDKRILGVTCSTIGGTEYQFSSIVHLGKRRYRCRCKRESASPTPSGKLSCFIHYWDCPLTTK